MGRFRHALPVAGCQNQHSPIFPVVHFPARTPEPDLVSICHARPAPTSDSTPSRRLDRLPARGLLPGEGWPGISYLHALRAGGATNCREDHFRQLAGGIAWAAVGAVSSPQLASRNDALIGPYGRWQPWLR